MKNRRQIDVIVKTFFASGQAPEDFSDIIGAENYNNYLASDNKINFLNKLGKEFEAGLESSNKDIFCYLMALKLTVNKVPRDYISLIRILKKKSMLDPSLLELLGDAYARRNALFADKKIESQNSFLQLVNQFETQREILLGERLDLAYSVYKKADEEISHGKNVESIMAVKQHVIDFMKTVLKVNDTKEIEIAMAERAKKSRFDPDFIPNRKPQGLSNLPDPHAAQDKATFNWRRISEAALALNRKDIVSVKEDGLRSDKETNTIFLEPHEHEKFQVIIKDGLFYEREADNTFTKCDTSLRLSHMKLDYAAIVVNLRGEITLFDHLDQNDKFAHSSMNAQAAILCSGEVKIIDGKLEVLTTHSGHYLPDEKNVYQLLKYFKEQGVDISEVTVLLWTPDHVDEKSTATENMVSEKLYYNAQDLFEKWEAGDKENIVPYKKATTNQILSMLDVDPNLKAERSSQSAPKANSASANDAVYTSLFQKSKTHSEEPAHPKEDVVKSAIPKKPV